jgi:hypothetical protein
MAVALFAALNYAFNSSSRVSTSLLTDSEATTYANQIIAYGNEVKSTVKRLQLRGCSDAAISFENDVVSGYENPNAPDDGSCNVFNIAGGGLSWVNPPPVFYNSSANWSEGKYAFLTGTEWDGVGTTCTSVSCSDVILFLNTLDEDTCNIINKNLGYSSTPQDSDFGGAQFNGTNLYGYTLADEVGGSGAQGRKSACFNKASGTRHYIYMQALIVR